MKFMDDEDCLAALQDVEVNVVGLVDWVRALFGQNGEHEITLDEFMETLIQLRGSNTATMKDVIELRKLIYASAEASMQCVRDLGALITKRTSCPQKQPLNSEET